MTSKSPFSFQDVTGDALLLVEGIEDARVFRAFLKDGLNATDVQIIQVGGNRRFRPFLSNILKVADSLPNLRRLGIIADADNDAAAAFRRIHDALANAGFPVPRRVWQPVQSGQLTVSVAILPDGSAPGDLEELCLHSIVNNPAWACIEAYIACMKDAGYLVPQPNKARLHAYLAAGDEPGRRLGEAAEAHVWDWASPAFAQMRQFLSDLAGD